MEDIANKDPETAHQNSSRKLSKVILIFFVIIYLGILIDQPHERIGTFCSYRSFNSSRSYSFDMPQVKGAYFPKDKKYKEYFLNEYMLGCVGDDGCELGDEGLMLEGEWMLSNKFYWLGGRDLLLRSTQIDPLVLLTQKNKQVLVPAEQFLMTFFDTAKSYKSVDEIGLFLRNEFCSPE